MKGPGRLIGSPRSHCLLSPGLRPHLGDAAAGLGRDPAGKDGLWIVLLLKPKLLKLRKFLTRLCGASNKLFITGCKRSQLRSPGLRNPDSHNLIHTSLETHILSHANNMQSIKVGILPVGSYTPSSPGTGEHTGGHKGTLSLQLHRRGACCSHKDQQHPRSASHLQESNSATRQTRRPANVAPGHPSATCSPPLKGPPSFPGLDTSLTTSF